MILFSIISFSLQATAEVALSFVSHQKISVDLKDKEPYCSIGLVQVHFSQVKLKKKLSDEFEMVDIGEVGIGTGFLIQSNVVVTAAHILMPKKFNLNELYADIFEPNNYCQFPDKVEFFPFFPHCPGVSYVRSFVRPQNDSKYSPQAAADEDPDILAHEELQRNLRHFFIVSQKWEAYLGKLNKGVASPSDHTLPLVDDYAVIVFEPNGNLRGLEICKDFNPEATRNNLAGFDILTIGYPSVLLAPGKGEEPVLPPAMFEFSGKALFPGSMLIHDCRLSKRCSGSPVLTRKGNGALAVIGLHVRGGNLTCEQMSREACVFTSGIIDFIERALRERSITPSLRTIIAETVVSTSSLAASGEQAGKLSKGSNEPNHDEKIQVVQKRCPDCCSCSCCTPYSCVIA